MSAFKGSLQLNQDDAAWRFTQTRLLPEPGSFFSFRGCMATTKDILAPSTARRMPTEYEIVTSKLLFYTGESFTGRGSNSTCRCWTGTNGSSRSRLSPALPGKNFAIHAKPPTQSTPNFKETRKSSSMAFSKRSKPAVTMGTFHLDGCMFFLAWLLLCDIRGTASRWWLPISDRWLRADALSSRHPPSGRRNAARATNCLPCPAASTPLS